MNDVEAKRAAVSSEALIETLLYGLAQAPNAQRRWTKPVVLILSEILRRDPENANAKEAMLLIQKAWISKSISAKKSLIVQAAEKIQSLRE